MLGLLRGLSLVFGLEFGAQLFQLGLGVVGALVCGAGARFELLDPLIEARELGVVILGGNRGRGRRQGWGWGR